MLHPVVTTGARTFFMAAITDARVAALSIGELSRRTGVHIETIRYYEKIEMLPAPPRTEGGRRVYGQSHVRTLAFIRRARELGFTPGEIRALLDLGSPERVSCAEVREIASAHLTSVRAKQADLAKLETILAGAIARCTGEAAPACPVLDVLDHSS
jgi:MerR family transcriptional regulator, mercuric resistance operon regulatory protein